MKLFKIEYPIGAAILNPNEIAGLKLSNIATQSELHAAEEENMQKGEAWAFSKKREDYLSEKFFRELHKKMFGSVWGWAGIYRSNDKVIGVEWYKIPAEMGKIIADVQYWIENKTYSTDEIAARFHHRLSWAHPFPNGNGRWARCMSDVLLFHLDQERFTWGTKQSSHSLAQHNPVREIYIQSLQKADSRNYKDLLNFVRS